MQHWDLSVVVVASPTIESSIWNATRPNLRPFLPWFRLICGLYCKNKQAVAFLNKLVLSVPSLRTEFEKKSSDWCCSFGTQYSIVYLNSLKLFHLELSVLSRGTTSMTPLNSVCALNSKLLFVIVLGLLNFFILLKNTIAPQTLFVLPSAATSRSLLDCRGICCLTSQPGHPCKWDPELKELLTG